MKKVYSLLVATVFAGSMVAPVLAHDEAHHKKATEGAYKHSNNMPAKHFKGEHSMTGTVSKIDHNTGMVDLKTQAGMALALHFPPTVIKDLKEGDQVAVQMEIAKQPSSMSPATIRTMRQNLHPVLS